MRWLLVFLLATASLQATNKILLVPKPPPEDNSKKREYPQAVFTFQRRGSLVSKLTMEQMAERVPPLELTVLDPYSLRDEIYTGFPLESLFYAIYGEAWRKADNEIAIHLANNKEVFVTGAKVIRYASYLAFEKRGASTFSVVSEREGKKNLELGPFYLIWDNFREPNLKDMGSKDWYYNIIGIDLLRYADKYPHTAPPAKSSQSVKNGFSAYQRNCALCHTINGEGSALGGDLNYPVSVTEYLSDHWLRKWIANPTSVRFNATMPALDKREPQVLNELISYLRVMAKHKKRPPTKKNLAK